MISPTAYLPNAPLGAGDLIDRAVRQYRRHLWTLMRIAAPPVIVAALGGILWTFAWRGVTSASDNSRLALYVFLLLFAVLLVAGGQVFNLVVMGGATRNLVAHLLKNEPVSARATYSAVRARFWSLIGATIMIVMWTLLSSMVAFFSWYFVFMIIGLGVFGVAQFAPGWLTTLVFIVGAVAATSVALWVFFLMIGRVAYVPQVMLVEGRSVFESLSRSFSLARGNVRRLMAMTLFVIFATQAALWILEVPLGWYGISQGVDPTPWNSSTWPVWYAIGYSILGPLSSMMLTPVWMLGLSLMYVDERVRHEGYDIELMAARQLGEMPKLTVESPFGPAISEAVRKMPPPPMASGRVLGL
ncbi:MAG TPA: hypothetical protein VE135_00240 [Pyrinomonadaceae bacterium]|nr:hypothetical protein [Pyrinomonadaceae bacterium]